MFKVHMRCPWHAGLSMLRQGYLMLGVRRKEGLLRAEAVGQKPLLNKEL